ncbi:enoyl-CoA hydratase/isomerase family protein [Asticcacaulis machinosus]|uniref:3-hydroxyisobutyryl-CoA hydrolase n=1 Tax=Asticcacaulis machinosus TaxID=2984211 RepID=A0ABT5HK34_9CAUL|nr:enoyl-CoA hydratase/isomerase family protein [Asticcacaulis machinosus]MDC7676612.1 enoyl-CoA hydratase/isomerase family protein [Asticcacaulis machinosus]
MTSDLIVRRYGPVGRITLNRPQALHALTLAMVEAMTQAFSDWRDDPSVARILIDHTEGTRGFCAGGDIRALADSVRGDGKLMEAFFAAEYRLNVVIHNYPKPVIALMDGIVMGGGVGISVHGSHRIATQNTVFAMPETAIGLFTDIGAGWFLSRLSGELGTWLGLAGARLKGADVATAGIATHYVADAQAFKAGLLAGGNISNHAAPMVEPAYGPHMAEINRAFAFDTVPEIITALEAGSDWAQRQADILKTSCPVSMAVTLKHLRMGRAMTRFEDVMAQEYRLARRLTRRADFAEGVRAVVVDKDQNPQWLPARPVDVDNALITELFTPLSPELF